MGLLTHAMVQLPLANGSHYCNVYDCNAYYRNAFFFPCPFFFFFYFYGLTEKTLRCHQHVQSAACRILTPRALWDVTVHLEGAVLALCQPSH